MTRQQRKDHHSRRKSIIGFVVCLCCFFLCIQIYTSAKYTLATSAAHRARAIKNMQADAEQEKFAARNNKELDNTGATTSITTKQYTAKPWAAICTMVRDEELYMDEFVDYYLGLGFKQLYVYDTHPNHTLKMHWNNTAPKGVRLFHKVLPNAHDNQQRTYTECVQDLRNLTNPPKWVMFIDADEYLVFQNVTQYDTVTNFFQQYVPNGALQISWIIFGTANETKYRPEPVTKRFQYRVKGPHAAGGFTKTIAVLDHIDYVLNPHEVILNEVALKEGHRRIAMDGLEITTAMLHRSRRLRATDIIALYHYQYKSLEENHIRRCIRGYKHKSSRMKERALCKMSTTPGSVFNNLAWETLKRNVPKYRTYDENDNDESSSPAPPAAPSNNLL